MSTMASFNELHERGFIANDSAHTQPDLRAGHLFNRSWEVFEREGFLVVGIFVVSLLIDAFLSGFRDGNNGGGVFGLIGLIVYGPMKAGINFTLVRLVRKEEVEFGKIFKGFLRFWPAAGVCILSWTFMTMGFVCVLLPGIIIGLGLIPCMYLVLEEKRGVFDTLSRAWSITGGHKWSLLKLIVVLVIFNMGGVLLCGVGVIFTGAFSTLVFAAAFDEMYQSFLTSIDFDDDSIVS